jgi:hypothetical protein
MGTINFRLGAQRLAKEAFSTGLFETSMGCSEEYIKQRSRQFWTNHKDILNARTHGFGYYLWKPEFIKLSLSEIPINHGLMYCDMGNLISNENDDIKTLISYLNLASSSHVVGSSSQEFLEKDWSTRELMDHLRLDSKSRESNQFMGGFLLVTNTPEGKSLVEDWANLACQENHKFLRPIFDNKNSQSFTNFSYDQGILSCLLKSRSKPSVEIGNNVKPGCVRVVRHRLAYPVKSKNTFKKVLFDYIAFMSRIRLAIERRAYKNSYFREPKNHPSNLTFL